MTDRQKAILCAVINEFMKDASAVGSTNVVAGHEIDASPATVRHEMVKLADKGYLTKEHLSSGRVPTDLGLRYFVQEIMEEEPLGNNDTVTVRIRVFKDRFDEEQLMSKVLTFLSEETGYAAVSLVNDKLRYRGVSSLLGYDELRDVEMLDVLLRMFESNTMFNRVLSKSATDDACVIIGNETDIEGLGNCSIVFSGFNYYGGNRGHLGVIGPRRMRYSRVIPLVKSVSTMVENAVRGW